MPAATIIYGWPYPVVGVDPPNGAAQIQSLAEAIESTVDGIDDRLDVVELRPRGLLAHGARDTEGPISTGSAVATLRIDDVAIGAGRAIACRYKTHPRSEVAGDLIVMELRYTTNGSTPTAASPILPGSQAYSFAQATDIPLTVDVETVYKPAVNETLSVVLCVTRSLGSGDVRLGADGNALTEIFLTDVGVSVANTGTAL